MSDSNGFVPADHAWNASSRYRRARAAAEMSCFAPVPGFPAIPPTIVIGSRRYYTADGTFIVPAGGAGRSLLTVSPYIWVRGTSGSARGVSAEVVHAGLAWIVSLLQAGRGRTAQDAVFALQQFERFILSEWCWVAHMPLPLTTAAFTADAVRAFKVRMMRSSGSSKYPVMLRWFYRWCLERRIPGFTTQCLADLEALRLSAGCWQSAVIRIGHPRHGALDQFEQRQVLRSVESPAVGASPYDRAIVWLCWELGLRPVQLEALRWRHLRPPVVGGRWIIEVPRAKDRSGALRARTIRRSVSGPLGELLASLRPPDATDDAYILHWIGDYNFSANITDRMRAWALLHNLITLRPWNNETPLNTGVSGVSDGDGAIQPPHWRLVLHPYRLRRTLATRLALAGASARRIAALLTDRTLAMATVYVTNAPDLVDQLEKMDDSPTWIRLLRLYRGSPVVDGDLRWPLVLGGVAHLAGGPEALIHVGAVGRCRRGAPCDKAPPCDCYTCDSFLHIADPEPHRRQLVQLTHDRDTQVGRASDRLDRMMMVPILAITELLVRLTGRHDGLAIAAALASRPVRTPFR